MKSLCEIFKSYSAKDCHSGSDKGTVHSFLEAYETLLAPYRYPGVKMLEIGLLTGASLLAFEAYFAEGTVYGIDLCAKPLNAVDLQPLIDAGHRIHLLDATLPEQVEGHFAGMTFDVIVEDASHALEHQLAIYNNFKSKLAPHGIYVIEDIENIDATRHLFENIDPAKRVQVIDRRRVKGRFDDVLVVIGGR